LRPSYRVFAVIVMLIIVTATLPLLLRAPFPSVPRGPSPPGQTPQQGNVSTSGIAIVGHLKTPVSHVTPTPAPASGPCTASSPYGFTTINADAQLVAEYRQLHVCWLRYQLAESALQTQSGDYDWRQLDAVVAAMNAAGIHLDFPLACFQAAGYTCFGHPYEPSTTQMAAFARQLALRYDGHHGHGLIEAFEIGNEEYDYYPASSYGPILQAGYQTIKALDPQALVGMYGSFSSSLSQTRELMTTLFASGYGADMDFMNFHYYNGGNTPAVASGDHPSFELKWQTMHAIAAHYGFASLPIWVTEVGWTTSPLPGRLAVSPQLQAQYLLDVMTQAAHSGVITRVFWFTIDYGTQPNSIDPPTGPLPAFYALQHFVQQHPQWT
jgi:hypothetical protein